LASKSTQSRPRFSLCLFELAMSAVYFAARLSFFSPGLKTLLIIGPLAKNSAIELAFRDFFCFCRWAVFMGVRRHLATSIRGTGRGFPVRIFRNGKNWLRSLSSWLRNFKTGALFCCLGNHNISVFKRGQIKSYRWGVFMCFFLKRGFLTINVNITLFYAWSSKCAINNKN